MHHEIHHDAVRRLQALIERETGAPLRDEVLAEMAAILRQGEGQDGPAGGDLQAAAPREVTILLADLRGFTALSGSQPASVVIAALNRCLARLSEVVFKYQGRIDKFMGDSIMVLFGAPEAREGDVDRALMCAVEMQIAMRELNLAHLRERLPEVFLGIGVNTGTVMASERMSTKRFIGETPTGKSMNRREYIACGGPVRDTYYGSQTFRAGFRP